MYPSSCSSSSSRPDERKAYYILRQLSCLIAPGIEEAVWAFPRSALLSKPFLPSKQQHLQSDLTAQLHSKHLTEFMAECNEAEKERRVSFS